MFLTGSIARKIEIVSIVRIGYYFHIGFSMTLNFYPIDFYVFLASDTRALHYKFFLIQCNSKNCLTSTFPPYKTDEIQHPHLHWTVEKLSLTGGLGSGRLFGSQFSEYRIPWFLTNRIVLTVLSGIEFRG